MTRKEKGYVAITLLAFLAVPLMVVPAASVSLLTAAIVLMGLVELAA